MKLQELSLSDLYGLRESFIAKYKHDIESSEKIEKIIENDPKIKPLLYVNNEIKYRETEIVNEIALDSFESRMERSKSYTSGNSWEKTMIDIIVNTSNEVINEIKNEG